MVSVKMLPMWLLAFTAWFLLCEGFVMRNDIGLARTKSSGASQFYAADVTIPPKDLSQVPLTIHHTALKTRNITVAVDFYGLFGFQVTRKFRSGPARAAWLEQNGGGAGCRIEILEVPSYMLKEPEGMKRRALDLAQKEELLGLNHLALDITASIREQGLESLDDWLQVLNEKSLSKFGKTMRVALEPRQQLIGSSVYELAFLYDADGALIELLHKQKDLPQTIGSGWEPWDGQDFVGSKK